jgi:3-deoxy-D-manno-octulosonate 8-phosphate phosphatase (KDO 8-P phosphatase)
VKARGKKGGKAAGAKVGVNRARAAPSRGARSKTARATRGSPSRDARLSRIRLLALDVDGVLTDGRIAYGAYGPADQIQHFHVQDGLALRWLAREGVAIAWITGRGCMANIQRARELEIDELCERVEDKGAALREIQTRRSIAIEETVAMGDDLPDLALRAASGFFAAPANAAAEVRMHADLVTRASGGAGAVRELVEAILRAKGRWQAILDAALR